MNISFPDLKSFLDIETVNPKNSDDPAIKIVATREGKYVTRENNVYNGEYMVYTNTDKFPDKYVAVFVDENLNEDESENIHPIALTKDSKKAINRMMYRRRVSEKKSINLDT